MLCKIILLDGDLGTGRTFQVPDDLLTAYNPDTRQDAVVHEVATKFTEVYKEMHELKKVSKSVKGGE